MQLSLWSAKYPPFWTQCVQCWFGSLLAYKLLYLCIVGTATASSVRIILLNIMLKMKQAKKSHGYAFHTSTLTQSKFTIYENINILNLCCQYHVWSQFISRYDIEITHRVSLFRGLHPFQWANLDSQYGIQFYWLWYQPVNLCLKYQARTPRNTSIHISRGYQTNWFAYLFVTNRV